MSTPLGTTTSTESAGQLTADSVLALLQISSPALPVGAFAYSQGLETAIDQGWCNNASEIYQWLENLLTFSLTQQDLPLYLRLHQAWENRDPLSVNYWNQTLLALRETNELYLEELQIGQAFFQWHIGQAEQEQRPEQNHRAELIHWCATPTAVGLHALAAMLAGIDAYHALLGFSWSWLENQVAAACKALPMGQSDAQKILQRLSPSIINACNNAQGVKDDEIGNGLYGFALASSWHETQYSRLFRS